MRKQTKLVAVVSASALLALGASLTSFAASKGTWMMVDGEWYCYDKNGDAYENTFCTSNGKDYYVGDDGQLVRSAWVEDDGNYYFVNSAGQKITNDWRLTAPYDDDSAEEQWYYFKSNGKRAEDEKITYKGKTYFFDSEGEMLTGWVQKSGDGWDEASVARYWALLAACDQLEVLEDHYSPGCMLRRNREMLRRAQLLISVFDGTPGGTAATVRLAEELGITVLPLWM